MFVITSPRLNQTGRNLSRCERTAVVDSPRAGSRDNFAATLHNPAMPMPLTHPKSDCPALRVSQLHKVYGSAIAPADVSFTAGRGEVVGLLGPNGAVKTTTINMVLGVLAATTGGVEIGGGDIAKQRTGERRGGEEG